MKKMKLVFIFMLLSQLSKACIKDSIFYNIDSPKKDRILLYDKEYFVWIYEQIKDKDTNLIISYGKYYHKKDTIVFTLPDSTDKPNSLFCFCKTKYDSKKKFQFHKKKNAYPPGQVDDAYVRIFNEKTPSKGKIVLFIEFKVQQANNMEFIIDKNRYQFLKKE